MKAIMLAFIIIAVLIILAVQLVIAGVVLWIITVQMDETNNLLGEIKMKQADFDKKVDELGSKVDALDVKSNAEAAQVNGLVQSYKDEIARMQAEHPDIDTSRLDALNGKLDEAATRIGAIVPDEAPQSAAPTESSAAPQPAQTVDPTVSVEEVPAAPVVTETPVE